MVKAKEKAVKYETGQEVEMMCSACDVEKPHKVEATTKQGKITRVVCTECQTESTFTRGVKTSVAMGGKSKTAQPYDRTRKYKKGQAMMHDKFGPGEVTAVVELQKIDVLFGDRTRRLIHAQE